MDTPSLGQRRGRVRNQVVNLGTARLEALYRMVTRGKPADARSLHVKSILAYQNGRLPDAAELSGKCVSLEPQSAQYQRQLGKVCAEAGWWRQAVIALNRAIYLDPYDPESWFGLGDVFSRVEKYDKAKFCFEQCALLKPDFIQVREALAEVSAKTAG
jgi:tetratricopeptide (TPR) repeat protein